MGVEFILLLIMFFIWVFVESFLLITWGTTPGKWLLNTTLTSPTGGTLFFFEAIYRSFSVWIKGLCMGLPFSFITLAVAYKKLTRGGITTWDKRGEFVVSHKRIGVVRVIVFLLIWIALAIFTQVVSEKYKINTNKDLSSPTNPQNAESLTAEDWFNKAQALWQDGKHSDPNKAIEYLNEAIRLNPNLTEAYYNRGLVYWNLNQYQRAIEDCNEAIRLNPNLPLTYYFRGSIYRKLGQYQRAIEDFNEAIRIKPDYADAYNNRGVVYLMMKDAPRGCKDAQKACSMGICRAYELARKKGICR
jgi:cytochrome c-type biogenesis protein CcmH/NrfG